MMLDLECLIIYWNFTSEDVMTLDWIEGVSIRETEDFAKKKYQYQKQLLLI